MYTVSSIRSITKEKMMYLQFQIILCIGLVFSTSANTTFNDVIDALTSKNLEMAQNKFHECVNISQINALQIEKENINTQLIILKNQIISGDISPNETSTKLLEFLELDASQNSEDLIKCCDIFHRNLFAVEQPTQTMRTGDMDGLMELKYDTAFNILKDCIKKYICFNNSVEDLHRGNDNIFLDIDTDEYEPNFKRATHDTLEKVFYRNILPNQFLKNITKYIHGTNYKIPFATYCTAAYYTYLIT
ncbi:uncharacterized protein LOC126894920 isoform X3 [Daktulosphaira vitifoliae]|uniref:uncharacterized protein LOC126894920 isoform X3 n=1 Tax=Daktulosphaira vitifoliae TaxID=58002 RepID=UPI0021A9BD56|nr:uncharacterized protein LOC126894920 isoform X3 [Daktulosphaira vitifoliae]